MKAFSRMVLLGAALGISGCGLPGTFTVEPFLNESIEGSDFNSFLAKGYQMKAEDAAMNDVNWIDAGMYAQKGRAVMAGETVLPWDPADHGVISDAMVDARNQLLAAIDANKDVNPEACAMAQVNYDQWVEETWEGTPPPPAPNQQRAVFFSWLERCAPPATAAAIPAGPSGPDVFTVYFGFDRTDLTTEARQAISNIVSALQNYANPNVSITGHADTAGPMGYNQGLSERRASTVGQALQQQGVPGNAISETGRGETDPAVETGDGVPEQLNRRAIIEIQ